MINRISKFREEAGLTQKQMADSAGWTQGRWSSYETGDRSPKPGVVLQIIASFEAHGVKVSFEKLFVESSAA